MKPHVPKMVALNESLSYIRPWVMDIFSRNQRSKIMRRVRSTGTQPEIIVRSTVRQTEIEYHSCTGGLPGKPDLVMLGPREGSLVRECFWRSGACQLGV